MEVPWSARKAPANLIITTVDQALLSSPTDPGQELSLTVGLQGPMSLGVIIRAFAFSQS